MAGAGSARASVCLRTSARVRVGARDRVNGVQHVVCTARERVMRPHVPAVDAYDGAQSVVCREHVARRRLLTAGATHHARERDVCVCIYCTHVYKHVYSSVRVVGAYVYTYTYPLRCRRIPRALGRCQVCLRVCAGHPARRVSVTGAALAERRARPGHPQQHDPLATARPRSRQLTGGTRRAAFYREPDQWTRLFDDARYILSAANYRHRNQLR